MKEGFRLSVLNPRNAVKTGADGLVSIGLDKTKIVTLRQSSRAEVRKQAENFADENFLFGKWKHFHAQRTASFAWGEVEIDMEIDETEHIVRQVEIATDCLQLQEIERARSMLTGASWSKLPDLSHESGIVRDIFHLVFSE